MPIPFFNNANDSQFNLVHLWIGSTPSSGESSFYNEPMLRPYPSFFWGCVKLFSVSNIPLRLVTTGERNGEMIQLFCKPVCNPTTCSNNGYCTELWRDRFNCDCGLSQFIGKRCNEGDTLSIPCSYQPYGYFFRVFSEIQWKI